MKLASLSLSLSLCVASFAGLSSAAAAQQPTVTIHPRVVADWGAYCDGVLPCPGVNEPALALTRRKQLGASQHTAAAASVDRPVRAVLGTNQSGNWTAHPLTSPAPLGSYPGIDVSVSVVDPALDSFVLFALNGPSTGSGTIRYRTWTPQAGFSTDWVVAYAASGVTVDKPWVIRRAANDFFVFWWGAGEYRYLRSTDGMNWLAPGGGALPFHSVPTTVGGEQVFASFCCQPSISVDGRVFLAHIARETGAAPGEIRVLIGTDPQGDNQGELTWEYMRDSEESLIRIPLVRAGGANLPVTCPASPIISQTVPFLACDPSDWGSAFLTYQDIAADDPSDVNVYFARLELVGGGPSIGWSAHVSTVVPEVTSLVGVRGDQFLPQIAVDSGGRIHLQYYDNRPAFVDDPDCPPTGWTGQYDAYYALSVDGGGTFERHILRPDCEVSPALNLDLQGFMGGVSGDFTPREYNGMALYESGGTTKVWMLYTGTTDEPTDNPFRRDVIYAQQVEVTGLN